MKRGEFSFVWLFAIIAGIMILFLAIYGVMRLSDTARYQVDTEVAKKISIITDPLQAGFAEGSFGKITFSSETRINNECFEGEFGKNEISVSIRSSIGKEWNSAGGATSIHNKYIFSTPENSGEEYYVFSKPFDFPYKVSDLVFLTADKYCFINTPDEITDEIKGLNIPNIAIENCTNVEDEIDVCFGSGDCEIMVYGACVSGCGDFGIYSEGSVIKDGEQMQYVGNLMYAAIFSNKEIYDCNVERLMYRTSEIAEVLIEKADLMNARDCGTNLLPDLYLMKASAMNSTSDDLLSINQFVKQVEVKNDREVCGLW